MEFRTRFVIRVDLVQNSIALFLTENTEGERKEQEKETKEDAIQIKSKHTKGIQNSELDFNLLFA